MYHVDVDELIIPFAAQDHFAIRYRESQSNDEQAACVVLLVSLCEVFSAKYVVAQWIYIYIYVWSYRLLPYFGKHTRWMQRGCRCGSVPTYNIFSKTRRPIQGFPKTDKRRIGEVKEITHKSRHAMCSLGCLQVEVMSSDCWHVLIWQVWRKLKMWMKWYV